MYTGTNTFKTNYHLTYLMQIVYISEYVKPEFIDATNKKQFIEKDTKNTKIINKLDNDLSYIIPSIQNNTNIRNIDDLKNYLVHNNIQLNDDDLNMAENLVEKYYKLNHNNILNHTTFKLSDLDMEMIVNIPQGGNWQNIPDNIIKKSERLKKIKQTGGRTTLYGRLDYANRRLLYIFYKEQPDW